MNKQTNSEKLADYSVVRVTGLTKDYASAGEAQSVLKGIDLSVQQGEMISLLGESGSGKSTLLNMLGAVDTPTSGEVVVLGKHLAQLSNQQRAIFRRRELGFIFQSFHLVPHLTVYENVSLPFLLDRRKESSYRDSVFQVLEKTGLKDFAKRYPDQLSGGQQQRVAVGRAVVHAPKLVLADEPTGNLDQETGALVLDLLTELQQAEGLTLIMATHSNEASNRCSRVIRLRDGQIVYEADEQERVAVASEADQAPPASEAPKAPPASEAPKAPPALEADSLA